MKRSLIGILLLALLAGCSQREQNPRAVTPAIRSEELSQRIIGLNVLTETTNFTIEGSRLTDLVILSTNELVPASHYSYRIQFMYLTDEGIERKIEADVPFTIMKQPQGFDRLVIRKAWN